MFNPKQKAPLPSPLEPTVFTYVDVLTNDHIIAVRVPEFISIDPNEWLEHVVQALAKFAIELVAKYYRISD